MEWWQKLLIPGSLLLIAGYGMELVKGSVFKQAREYADNVGKPLLNVGCQNRFTHLSDVNLDIVQRDVPNFVLGDVQDLSMFQYKQFGSAFVSHVLEHVDNPDLALGQLNRVADKVFVITPSAINPWAYVATDHKWLFVGGNEKYRIYPIVCNAVYWGLPLLLPL